MAEKELCLPQAAHLYAGKGFQNEKTMAGRLLDRWPPQSLCLMRHRGGLQEAGTFAAPGSNPWPWMHMAVLREASQGRWQKGLRGQLSARGKHLSDKLQAWEDRSLQRGRKTSSLSQFHFRGQCNFRSSGASARGSLKKRVGTRKELRSFRTPCEFWEHLHRRKGLGSGPHKEHISATVFEQHSFL